MSIQMKRIYEESANNEGVRILVDRLWPRGVSKEKANLDFWLKEIGPSHELRKWFSHDPKKFPDFKKKYLDELTSGEQYNALQQLKEIVNNENQDIILLFASKEETYNHVAILKEMLHNM